MIDIYDHRKFYVNEKLEFALFYDSKIVDKGLILKTFLESKEWKSFCHYFSFKVSSTKISKDLKEVHIVGHFGKKS